MKGPFSEGKIDIVFFLGGGKCCKYDPQLCPCKTQGVKVEVVKVEVGEKWSFFYTILTLPEKRRALGFMLKIGVAVWGHKIGIACLHW